MPEKPRPISDEKLAAGLRALEERRARQETVEAELQAGGPLPVEGLPSTPTSTPETEQPVEKSRRSLGGIIRWLLNDH